MNTTFDAAYTALEEIFPGHPLLPAARICYIYGDAFGRIDNSSLVYDVRRLWPIRVRSIPDNARLFWGAFDSYFNLRYSSYRRWVLDIANHFRVAIMGVARNDGKLEETLNRILTALIRDYRYVGETEKADQLANYSISDARRPEDEVWGAVNEFVQHVQPRNEVKDGFPLSTALCNSARPLLLKCLTDLMKGTANFIDATGTQVPSKYRLFFRLDEDAQWDKLIEHNQNGLETGASEGHNIGNLFLENEVGRALLGAVAQLLLGSGHHMQVADQMCNLFFWQNYDGWLERFLQDMVENESPKPGQNPHLRCIANYPTHYFNTGHFKGVHKITSYVQPILDDLAARIRSWPDNRALDQEVLELMKSQRVGSGSGVATQEPLAKKLEAKYAALAPKNEILQLGLVDRLDREMVEVGAIIRGDVSTMGYRGISLPPAWGTDDF